MAVKPIPDGYHSVTPYLMIRGAAKALDFYVKAFGAIEMFRMPMPNGLIGHAEIKIGDSVIMMADEQPGALTKGPESLGGPGLTLMLYVPDVDGLFAKAVAAGCKVLRPLADQFYGDRTASLVDPFGHMWTIATHVKDMTPDEMMKAMSGG